MATLCCSQMALLETEGRASQLTFLYPPAFSSSTLVAWGAWGSAGCYGASSYASSGCLLCRQSQQYTLPGARTTALVQSSTWHRLPPPCETQCGVPPVAAPLGQPKCWHRLPPPCALQCCVSPNADLRQPSCWQRLPCALQCCVPPCAAVRQPACWQRLPPPCALQWPVSPAAPLEQPSS